MSGNACKENEPTEKKEKKKQKGKKEEKWKVNGQHSRQNDDVDDDDLVFRTVY